VAVKTQPTRRKTFERLGSDLSLTRYTGVPGGVPLEVADSWGSLDLRVVPGGRGGLKQAVEPRDLGAVAGRENLGQAVILRLLTPRGALARLGHPDYGSRLIELIGGPNNVTTRNLARLFTLEALQQEPRIREVIDLTVDTPPGQPDTIRLGLSLLPLDDDEALTLNLDVTL
jgi:phage baseplate assembly protein W